MIEQRDLPWERVMDSFGLHTLNSKIDLVSATVTTDLQVSSLLFQLKVAADSERRSRVKSEQAGGRRGERPAETRRE